MNWDDHRPTRQCRCRWHQYHWEYSTKVFFYAKNRQVLIDCVPLKVRFDGECDRHEFGEFMTKFSIILRAISSKQTVNTEQLDQLCKETSIKLVTHWPTFRFTPSVHQILAHSAALIHENESLFRRTARTLKKSAHIPREAGSQNNTA